MTKFVVRSASSKSQMFLIFVFSVQILSPKRGFPPIAVSPSVQLSYSETCYTLFLYIRNSKLCFRLAVLNFFFISKAERFLICSYFLDRTVQYHREQCQTEYNKNTLFHFLHSFSFKQPLGGVLQKSGFATELQRIKKYLQKSSIFH